MLEQTALPGLAPTDLDPLMITSPTLRCGTTLLQRLLCSSKHALIYGEKCARDLEMFLNIHAFKAQDYSHNRAAYQRELQKVLQGDVNDWISDLVPDPDGYLAVLQGAAFAGISYCRDYAVRAGRPVWGLKYPGWSPVMLSMLRTVMPRARFIFILRDLSDCLRSAKAQQLVVSAQDVRDFCRMWVGGAAYARTLGTDQGTLLLDYADLVRRPQETLARIGSFAGVQDMDAAVLEHKINIWVGREFAAQTADGYIPPAELSQAEQAIVAEATSPAGQPALIGSVSS